MTAPDFKLSDMFSPTKLREKLQAMVTWLTSIFTTVAKDATVAKEATLGTSSDTSSATTIYGKLAAILAAVGNIDFSTLAKQGSDSTATNTAIKQLIEGFVSGCDFVQNNDGDSTYTLVIDDTASVEGGALIA